MTEERKAQWSRREIRRGGADFSFLGFALWGTALFTRDPELFVIGPLSAIGAQITLGWLTLARADAKRFVGGDFWVAAAWLGLGGVLWAPLLYAWGPMTASWVGWPYFAIVLAVSMATLWLAAYRQTLSSLWETRLLRGSVILWTAVGVIAALGAVVGGTIGRLGLVVGGVLLSPFSLWLARRFFLRHRDGRQTR
ncbi:hypothetical protein [Phenylobacterium sp. J367]|uniref:hypothetical protein n=1 Tax=Phenylobacterium sp. J367 TaxID=2898435 RepID=UPI0021514287|nr:hypothetical protein [Phenylobacterium sp. J367]MCR5879426.1 hypothetical protein [Phenylobacterium sp. J367]